MGRSIWEHVAANKIEIGDILAWQGDTGRRVRVDGISEHPTAEVLPAVSVHVHGPTDRFAPLAGLATGSLFRQGDAIKRMVPERAARVSNTNLRTVVAS